MQLGPGKGGFVQAVLVEGGDADGYPFNIPAIRALDCLKLDPHITVIVGENGSGKSTLIEAIAVAAGFNAEGGTKNFNFATRRSESELHDRMRLARGIHREKTGFFLRAESFFNLASNIEELDREYTGPDKLIDAYGGISLHEQSHGESFIALVTHRFGDNGLYVLDEPEAALSPSRQLALLSLIHRLIERGNSQFVVATHSPILMAYPGALIYRLDTDGITQVAYEETEHFRVTKDFLTNRDVYLRHLFAI